MTDDPEIIDDIPPEPPHPPVSVQKSTLIIPSIHRVAQDARIPQNTARHSLIGDRHD